ncbi:MAG: hypothetical protein QM765_30395 [Myxococcales bacterium]
MSSSPCSAPSPTDAGHPRCAGAPRSLLAAHAGRWTGKLPGIDPRSRRFERGFLVEARTTALHEELMAASRLRDWLTLEALAVDARTGYAELIRAMPSLRTLSLEGVNGLHPEANCQPVPSLRALTTDDWMPSRELKQTFPNLDVLGGSWSLYRYDWRPDQFRELLTRMSDAGIQAAVLKAFPLGYLVEAFEEWTKAGGPAELRLAGTWSQTFETEGWRIRLRRGSDRAQVVKSEGLTKLAVLGIKEVGVYSVGSPFDLAATAEILWSTGLRVVASDDPIELADPPVASNRPSRASLSTSSERRR